LIYNDSKNSTNPYVKGITIIAALLTLVLFGMSKVSPKKPELEVQLLKVEPLLPRTFPTNIFRLHKDSLDVTELRKKFNTYDIRIINKGKEDIGKDFYDTIKLKLSDIKFITEPSIHNTSHNHLNYTNLEVIGDSLINFSSMIINSEEFFDISFLSASNEDNEIEIDVFGNIKGQGQIKFENDIKQKPFANILNESLLTHFGRLLFYAAIFLALIGFANLFIIGFRKWKNFQLIRQREKNVQKFKNLENYNYTRTDEVIFSKYIDQGIDVLKIYSNKISSLEKLDFHLNKYKLDENSLNKVYHVKDIESMVPTKREYLKLAQEIKLDGYVYFEEDKILKNNRLLSVLEEFIRNTK